MHGQDIYTYNILFFFLLLCLEVTGQDCNFPSPPSNTCANAPLLCNLDGYCSDNSAAQNSGTPNAFCGFVENNNWVSFIAGSTEFELKVTVDNCANGLGLQAQIFRTNNCQFFTSVSNCLDPVIGSANIIASGLVIGQVYYLMMDGKEGDVCDYSYEVLSGMILSPAEAVIDSAGFLCEGDTLILDGSASASGPGITYQWSSLDGNILSGENTPVIEVDASGTYQILIMDDGGCKDSAQIQIVESPMAIIEIDEPDTLNCANNGTVTLFSNDAGGGQQMDFVWTTQTGNIVSGENTPNPVVDAPGIYFLTITNSISGCSDLGSVEVVADIVFPEAMASVSDELNCLNSEVDLLGTGSSVGNNFAYQWSTFDGNIQSGENTLNAIADAPGHYFLEVINLENDCISTDEVEVTENPEEPIGAIVNVQHPCFGETYGNIEIESVIGGTTPFLFAFDSLNFSTDNYQDQLEPASYFVTIKDDIGCEWDTIINIETQPELIVDLGEDITIQLGCELDLVANINFTMDRIDSIIWSPEIDCFLCPEQTVSPLESTVYSVEVTNANGCTERDEIIVSVKKDRLIYIPNIFTPNFDGINDLFIIHGGKGVKQVETLRIFNRWGALVFEQKNFQPNDSSVAWNGVFKDKILEDGVFVYYVEVEFVDGIIEVYKGDVVLTK